MPAWTPERLEKFRRTMAEKKAVRETTQSIPLDAIPGRKPKRGKRKAKPTAKQQARQRVNGVLSMHAEVDAKTGELLLVFGPLRVPLKVRG